MKRSVLATVFLLVCAYIAYPYISLWRLQSAIKQRDAVTLDTLVDWPQLRTSIKTTLMAEMADKITKTEGGMAGVGAAVGTTLGAKFIETVLDSVVSSQGLFRLAEQSGAPKTEPLKYMTWAFFVSPTTFRIDFENPDVEKRPRVTLVMTLTSAEWKVSALSIPASVLSENAELAHRLAPMEVPISTPRTGQLPGTVLTAATTKRLVTQMQRCWSAPAYSPEAVVKVRVRLAMDGSLLGNPEVLNDSGSRVFRAAADSAVQALRRCAPYRGPSGSYESWKELEITFDPREATR
jgi:hypothetical protein